MSSRQMIADRAYTYIKNGIKIMVAVIPGVPIGAKVIDPVLDIIFSNMKWAGLFKDDLTVAQQVELRQAISKTFKELEKKIPTNKRELLERARPGIEVTITKNLAILSSCEITDKIESILAKPINTEGDFFNNSDFDELTITFLNLLGKNLDNTPLAATLNREGISSLRCYINEKFKENDYAHVEFFRMIQELDDKYSNMLYASVTTNPRNDLKQFCHTYKNEPLFLEHAIGDGRTAHLSDLYVVPVAKFFIKSQTDTDYRGILVGDIIRKIDEFVCYGINYRIGCYTIPNVNSMVILGQPGIGKSSITFRLASDYDDGKIFIGKKMFCFRLRDLSNWNINIENPLDSILNYMKISKPDLDDSVLLLDGLDELCGIACMENSIDTFCKNLLAKCNRSLKIIITSRLNYLQLPPANYPHSIFMELQPFNQDKRLDWVINYIQVHENANLNVIKAIRDYLPKGDADENEFMGMPLALYIITSLQINFSADMGLSDVYDKMLDQLRNRNYDENEHDIVRTIEYEAVVKSLALKMFSTDKFVLNSDEVEDVVKDIAIDNEDISKISNLYGMSFYFKGGIPEKRSVEFIHRSLGDYVVSWKIYDDLKNNLVDLKLFWEEVDNLFGNNEISPEIMAFLIDRLNKAGEQIKQKFAQAFRRHFTDILERGMLFCIDSNINAIDKAAHIFYSYWRIMKTLNPDTNLVNSSGSSSSIDIDLLEVYLRGLYEKRKYPIDFSSQVTKNLDLRGADLSGCNFSNSYLVFANFRGCMMQGVLLDNATLEKADFSGANASESSFVKTKITGCVFYDVVLNKSKFFGATIDEKTYFDKTQLNSIVFDQMYLGNIDFNNSIMNSARFVNVNFVNVKFPVASRKDKLYVYVENCKFINSLLVDIVFTDCSVKNCCFGHSNFSNSDLRGFNFMREDFENQLLKMGDDMFVNTIMAKSQINFLLDRGLVSLNNQIIVRDDWDYDNP